MGALHVGISTFADPAWKGEGRFYPPKTKAADFLAFYASRYSAFEADGTFYRNPIPSTVAKWVGESPVCFRISPKLSQSVTHFARLKPASAPAVQSFLEALDPVERAGKLGPILVQLPPNLKRDDELLGSFLASIPHRISLRWAIEFRHESWKAPEIESLLRAKKVAWVLAETDETTPPYNDTSDQVYVRLRKVEYADSELDAWRSRLAEFCASGKDCFVYCRHKDVAAPWKWADRLLGLT